MVKISKKALSDFYRRLSTLSELTNIGMSAAAQNLAKDLHKDVETFLSHHFGWAHGVGGAMETWAPDESYTQSELAIRHIVYSAKNPLWRLLNWYPGLNEIRPETLDSITKRLKEISKNIGIHAGINSEIKDEPSPKKQRSGTTKSGTTTLQINRESDTIFLNDVPYHLTSRQKEILVVLCEAKGTFVPIKTLKVDPSSDERPLRIVNRMPDEIRNLIKYKSKSGLCLISKINIVTT